MKLASIPYSRSKLLSLSLIVLLLISSFMVVPVMAARPPTVAGHEDYMEDYGVLHNDTYILYPWEKKSLDIGFSKYGEKISNVSQGLEYDGVDAFANTNVSERKWSCGWLMDIHYTEDGILKNVWAYALYTDYWPDDDSAFGGPWRQRQNSTDATASGDAHRGRRTSGYAVTDDIRLIYDGPRKSIYLLNTTIYDKDPANEGDPMVELTIQIVFNKVKKYVMQIKDIKRVDNQKWVGPFQIEFSERAEWDLKNHVNPQSYAEFYDNLTTKYIKHPFYPVDENVTYDLCQMISDDNVTVGFAAFWPRLISKWVEGTDTLTRARPDVAGDLLYRRSTGESVRYRSPFEPHEWSQDGDNTALRCHTLSEGRGRLGRRTLGLQEGCPGRMGGTQPRPVGMDESKQRHGSLLNAPLRR